MNNIATLVAALVLLVPALGADLKPDAVSAWRAYTATVDHDSVVATPAAPPVHSSLRQGKVSVSPGANGALVPISDGLIHHWVGRIFIPGATISDVLAVTRDYAAYKNIYQPAVADSTVVACDAGEQRFALHLHHRELGTTTAVRAEFVARDFPGRDRPTWVAVADSVHVQEVKGLDSPAETLLPDGKGSGFMWALHNVTRLNERDGGVYLEVETLLLSRQIPSSLRWLVVPIATRIAKTSLQIGMMQTRDAVLASLHSPKRQCDPNCCPVIAIAQLPAK